MMPTTMGGGDEHRRIVMTPITAILTESSELCGNGTDLVVKYHDIFKEQAIRTEEQVILTQQHMVPWGPLPVLLGHGAYILAAAKRRANQAVAAPRTATTASVTTVSTRLCLFPSF
jgi:hypothetical protein